MIEPGMQKRHRIALFINRLEGNYQGIIRPGIMDMAEKLGLNLVVLPGNSIKNPVLNQRQLNIIYQLIQPRNIDGIIMIPGLLFNNSDPREIEDFMTRYEGTPMVSIGQQMNGMLNILTDNRKGLGDAIDHLIIDHKLSKLVFIKGPVNNTEAEERFEAYKNSLSRHSIAFDHNMVIDGDFSYDCVPAIIKTILDERKLDFEALIFANDTMALGCIKEFTKLGLRIPEDFAVIGFDNIAESRFSLPPLTTVGQPLYEMGMKAVEILNMRILGISNTEQLIPLPTELIVRQSCGCKNFTDIRRKDNIRITDTDAINYIENISRSKEMIINQVVQALERNKPGNESPMELADQIFEYINNFYNLKISQLVWDLRFTSLSLTSTFDLDEFIKRLGVTLVNFDVQGCYIVLYEGIVIEDSFGHWKLPELSRLTLAYSEGAQIIISPESAIFPTSHLLPNYILIDSARFTTILMPLQFGQEQFGYILYEISGTNLETITEILRVQISNAIMGSKTMDELRKAKESTEHKNKELAVIAKTDSLTRLLNHGAIHEQLEITVHESRRNHFPVSVMMIDIDNFKQINDSFGHPAGDHVITEVAQVLHVVLRPYDIKGRYGGDEFLIILPYCGINEINAIAERVFQGIHTITIPEIKNYLITPSVGIAILEVNSPCLSIKNLIKTADKALYHSKTHGKDQTTILHYGQDC